MMHYSFKRSALGVILISPKGEELTISEGEETLNFFLELNALDWAWAENSSLLSTQDYLLWRDNWLSTYFGDAPLKRSTCLRSNAA